MRPVVEHAVERLAHHDLSARRPDRIGELGHQVAAVAVGGDEHALGVELLHVGDGIVLAELRACRGGARREPAHEARRLDGAVAVVMDRSVETGELVEPVGGEAVLVQRLVLRADVLALLLVGGEPVAARPVQRVAGELLHRVECLLRPAPERARLVGAVGLARDVVARRASAQRETAVAAARALRHRAPVVDANAQPRLREAERCAAAGDARADDRHVDPAVVTAVDALRDGILEPVRIHDPDGTSPS